MKPWFNKHGRLRDRLSAFLDGELPGRESAEVQSHIETCEACRRELEELRAASAILRALPVAEPRRSFALGPEMAGERPRQRAAHTTQGLAMGMRLAAAGLAAALAVVFVADLSTTGSQETTRDKAAEAGANALAIPEPGLSDSTHQNGAFNGRAETVAPSAAEDGSPTESTSNPAAGGADDSGAAGAATETASQGSLPQSGEGGETPAPGVVGVVPSETPAVEQNLAPNLPAEGTPAPEPKAVPEPTGAPISAPDLGPASPSPLTASGEGDGETPPAGSGGATAPEATSVRAPDTELDRLTATPTEPEPTDAFAAEIASDGHATQDVAAPASGDESGTNGWLVAEITLLASAAALLTGSFVVAIMRKRS